MPALQAQFELPKFSLPNFGDGKTQKTVSDVNVELKMKLLEICSAARQGIDGTGPATQEEFDALVEELITKNPTQNAAESPLMTGTWKMVPTFQLNVPCVARCELDFFEVPPSFETLCYSLC